MKYCPHCHKEITELNYCAYFSETQYGKSNGIYSIEEEEHEMEDTDYKGSDNWEEEDFEYYCPECEKKVELDDLLDIYDNEEENKKKKIDIILKGILANK